MSYANHFISLLSWWFFLFRNLDGFTLAIRFIFGWDLFIFSNSSSDDERSTSLIRWTMVCNMAFLTQCSTQIETIQLICKVNWLMNTVVPSKTTLQGSNILGFWTLLRDFSKLFIGKGFGYVFIIQTARKCSL